MPSKNSSVRGNTSGATARAEPVHVDGCHVTVAPLENVSAMTMTNAAMD